MKNLILLLVALTCTSFAHSACMPSDLSVLGQSNQQMLGDIVASVETTETLKVRFSGEITKSSIDRLIRKIDEAVEESTAEYKEVVITMSSLGGDINHAIRAIQHMRMVNSRPDVAVHTRVSGGSCESACTILFTGGERRYASKRARFGFHSPKFRRGDRGGRSSDEIEEIFRRRWLSIISYVDQTAASTVASNRYLYDEEMSYMSGGELETGYVTDRL